MSSSSSGTHQRQIPEDLINEILIRSPAKSLLRFKSTCKNWKTLISSLTFIKSHVKHLSVTRYPPLPSVILFRSDGKVFSVDFRSNYESDDEKGKFKPCDEFRGGRPLASCHGIICMMIGKSNMYLWNPVLNQSKRIGYLNNTVSNICGCGFGYVSSIDGYKIVVVIADGWNNMHTNKNVKFQIQVYSTRNMEWRALNTTDRNTVRFPLNDILNAGGWGRNGINSDSVLHNESVCWIVGRDLSYSVLKFDLKNEVFDRITIPKLKSKDYDKKKLCLRPTIGVTPGNNLCIGLIFTTTYYEANFPSCVQMWELRQGRWEKFLRVQGDWKYLGDNYELVGLVSKSKVLIFKKMYNNPEYMLIVDAHQDPPTCVHIHNEYCTPNSAPYYKICFNENMLYVPSLLSPLRI